MNLVINNLLYDNLAVALLLSHLHQRFPFTQFQVSRQVYMGVWDAMLYGDYHGDWRHRFGIALQLN